MSERTASLERLTKETKIRLQLSLDGAGQSEIKTGFGFLDHMLTLFSFWGALDLRLACEGDLEVDAHHSVEDVAICLGQALLAALGERRGIARMGQAKVPMDEALAEAVLDLSGRPFFVLGGVSLPPVVAGEESDLWREFFKTLAFSAKMNLHINLVYGQNGHHLLEAAFKALGLALRQAVTQNRVGASSTKGSLD